jgi:hypothetical protein
MLANENTLRALTTDQFLNHGLGCRLSHDASTFIDANVSESHTMGSYGLVIACGSIVERVFWLELGQWLNYFKNDVESLNTEEKGLFVEGATILSEYPWPNGFSQTLELLSRPDFIVTTSLFNDQIDSSGISKGSAELRPVFQAAHVISEGLTVGPIPAFFRFLSEGDIGYFNSRSPLPERINEWLRVQAPDHGLQNEIGQREEVIAGFIRYTQFLSAMEGLFPFAGEVLSEQEPQITPEEKLLHAILGEESEDEAASVENTQRQLLAREISEIIRWRVPMTARARVAFYAVQLAFRKVVSKEFQKYSSSGLSWHSKQTEDEILRLSARFFGMGKPEQRALQELMGVDSTAVEAKGTAEFGKLREMEGGETFSGGQFVVEE